jgi:hypothetical protein
MQAQEAAVHASESGRAVVTARAVESARPVPLLAADTGILLMLEDPHLADPAFAVEEVLATAVPSGELILDEAGCT